jgi:glycosyltransferase involved in cell wall biosynthesis
MRKNILVLTYWSFKDALIQTYTLPYVRIIKKYLPEGSKLFLLTFEQENFKMTKQDWTNIKSQFKKEDIYLIRFQYNGFGIKAIFLFPIVILRLFFIANFKKISYIHAWCTVAGAIGYFLSVITRKPLIVDSFEPQAEPMVESNTWKKSGFAFKFLFKMERLQSKRAIHVIFCVESMKDYSKEKYHLDLKNYFVKPACIDFEKFNYHLLQEQSLIKKHHLEDSIVCVYCGKFGDSYLTNDVFDFFKACYDFWGDRFKALIISSNSIDYIHELAQKSKFPIDNIVKVFIDFIDVPKYLTLADFAITPTKPIPSKRYSTPIKDGEYWAMGLPVVITKDISDDSEIIEMNNIGAVLIDLNIDEYIKAIFKINELLKNNKDELRQKILNIAKKYRSFDIAEKVYKSVYKNKY